MKKQIKEYAMLVVAVACLVANCFILARVYGFGESSNVPTNQMTKPSFMSIGSYKLSAIKVKFKDNTGKILLDIKTGNQILVLGNNKEVFSNSYSDLTPLVIDDNYIEYFNNIFYGLGNCCFKIKYNLSKKDIQKCGCKGDVNGEGNKITFTEETMLNGKKASLRLEYDSSTETLLIQ